jgi:hypothetical protein
MLFHCAECGGDVVMQAKAGRTREMLVGYHVEIPADVEMPTCQNCGEEYVSLDVTEPLDRRLRKTCINDLICQAKDHQENGRQKEAVDALTKVVALLAEGMTLSA